MSLLPVPPLHPHSLGLCVLIHAFVTKPLVNHAEQQRREIKLQEKSSSLQQQQPSQNIIMSPNTSHIAASTAASPNASSSPFFASPPSSTAGTPAPKSFNLGLNLGFGINAAASSAASAVQPFVIAQDHSTNTSTRAGDHAFVPAAFTKKHYQQLGLLLQKAIQKGATYNPALYTSTAASSGAPVPEVPLCPPRYPTFQELRTMLLEKLPKEDGFHLAMESHFNEKIQSLNQPDDIFELVSSLANLLIVYSHKIPQLAANQELQRLDEGSPLGIFVRQQKLLLDAGLFDTISRAFDALLEYRSLPIFMAEEKNEEKKRRTETLPDTLSVRKNRMGHESKGSGGGEALSFFDASSDDITMTEHKDGMEDVAAHENIEANAHVWSDPTYGLTFPENELFPDLDTSPAASIDSHPSTLASMPLPSSTLAPFLYTASEFVSKLASRYPVEELDSFMQQLQQAGAAEIPFFHYFAFIKHVNAREFSQALDSCYRYFDYYSGQSAAFANNNPVDQEDAPSASVKMRRTQTQQYASLALSQLHYSFAHFSSSVTSIQETIKKAQQNKDANALRFAMELLHKIIEMKSTTSSLHQDSNTNLLHRALITQSNAAARAKKANNATAKDTPNAAAAATGSLPQLDASNALMMAKLLVVRMQALGVTGSTAQNQPQDVWRSIERAICLMSSPRSPALIAAASVLKSSVWNLFGSHSLAQLHAYLHTTPPTPAAAVPPPEAAAIADATTRRSNRFKEEPNARESIQALSQLILNPAACPTYSSQRSALSLLKSLYPYPHTHDSVDLQLNAILSEVEMEMNRGDFIQAKQIAQRHVYALTPSKLTHFQASMTVLFLELQLDYYGGHASLTSIYLKLLSLITEAQEKCERGLAVKIMRFMVRVLLNESVNHCSTFSHSDDFLLQIGLSPLLSAFALSKALHFRSAELEIMVYIASLMLQLGEADQCERMLKENWIGLMRLCRPIHAASTNSSSTEERESHPGTELMARVYYLLAQCELSRMQPRSQNSMSDDEGQSPIEQEITESWKLVIQYLRSALNYASPLSLQLQLYYLLSRSYEELHMTAERNECAAGFCRLEQQLEVMQ